MGTRWAVYQVTVLAVLLYGAETWTLKTPHLRCLTVFHNHCIRTILGISRYEQWQQHLISVMLLDRFGTESICRIIVDKHLCWLGHVGQMSETTLDNQTLCCLGRWQRKDLHMGQESVGVSSDLNILGIDRWHELCQDRDCWYQRCREGISHL